MWVQGHGSIEPDVPPVDGDARTLRVYLGLLDDLGAQAHVESGEDADGRWSATATGWLGDRRFVGHASGFFDPAYAEAHAARSLALQVLFAAEQVAS